jgi:hypothetical protein
VSQALHQRFVELTRGRFGLLAFYDLDFEVIDPARVWKASEATFPRAIISRSSSAFN